MPLTREGTDVREYKVPAFYSCETIEHVRENPRPVDKAQAVVGDNELGLLYKFNTSLSSADDGFSILQPSDTTWTGRWELVRMDGRNDANVIWFGAVGDNTTDDATAIQAAFTYAATLTNGKVIFPSGYTGFASESAITCAAGIDVEMFSPMTYTGSLNETLLTIGSVGAANTARTLNLRVTKSVVSDWTSEDSIGIKLIGLSKSTVRINTASSFTIGLQILADGALVAHNVFTLGSLVSNSVGLDLTNNNGSAQNENLFLGGEFTVNTGVNTSLGRTGIRITSQDAGYEDANNNVFLKPSFELNAADTSGVALPIDIVYGLENKFYAARSEGNDSNFMKVQNSSYGNAVIDLHQEGDADLDNDSTGALNTITTDQLNYLTPGKLLFDSGAMHKTACYYDGSSAVNIPKVSMRASSGSSFFDSFSGITLNATNLEIIATRGVGITVDTTINKRFCVTRDVVASFGGRVFVRPLDGPTGTIITTAGTVAGINARPYTYDASIFGGVWGPGSNSDNDAYFEVSDATKEVEIIVGSSSTALKIRNFRVYCMDFMLHAQNNPAAWNPTEGIVLGGNLASTPPTAGTWAQGRIVWDSTPSASGTMGWVCVTAGTPGTWKSFGAISA